MKPMNTPLMSAADIARRVRSQEIRAVDVLEKTLGRIRVLNPILNAFTRVTEERAIQEAEAVDRLAAQGKDPGLLAGVPFAVKNLFDLQGEITLAGSKISQREAPASMDATVVRHLVQSGAVTMGALNMGEYAYDFTGENVHYGASRNPHDPSRMTGGSSGGSGAAVGGGMVPFALGSDTNGSIRVPASLCGIFGLKPTYGRLSRAGTFAFCPSLDHVGPLARTVADLAMAYDAMQGTDPTDPVCSERAVELVLDRLGEAVGSLNIAIASGYFSELATPLAEQALARVAAALNVRDSVEIQGTAQARAAAYLITNAESSNLHLVRLRQFAADYDPDVRDRMLAGALLPSSWIIQAQRFRRWYRDTALRVFAHYDILLAPATPMSAPAIGQRHMVLDGEEMLVRPHLGLYTQPLSFIGFPVVVVPVALAGEMPIGVQIVAAPWRENLVLKVAAYLEQIGFTSPEPL